MELTPLALVSYYRRLETANLADFPLTEIVARYSPNEVVLGGFRQLWKGVHMRRQLDGVSIGERRELEQAIRNEMSLLNQTNVQELQTWNELHAIHHWSVTADQAEMLATSFAM